MIKKHLDNEVADYRMINTDENKIEGTHAMGEIRSKKNPIFSIQTDTSG
jgi:hypothetical protein